MSRTPPAYGLPVAISRPQRMATRQATSGSGWVGATTGGLVVSVGRGVPAGVGGGTRGTGTSFVTFVTFVPPDRIMVGSPVVSVVLLALLRRKSGMASS